MADHFIPPLNDVFLATRFLRDVPAYFRRRFDEADAARIVRQRRERRQTVFLRLIERVFAPRLENPYPGLFAQAGCQPGDVQALVRSEGVEGALDRLYRIGIYLTADEFKARQPIRRGSSVIEGSSAGLLNPSLRYPIPASSGGSGRGPSIVPVDLRFVHAYAANSCLHLAARNGAAWVKSLWAAPGSSALAGILEYSVFGSPLERYFRLVNPESIGLHTRYVWSERALRWLGAAVGQQLPQPVLAAPDDPQAVLRWLLDVREAGAEPHLRCFVSLAVNLALEAAARGTDLSGMHFTISGEPLTESRLATLQRAGADFALRYGITEAGIVGLGCLEPAAGDGLHLMDDLLAAIEAPHSERDSSLPPGALLLSGLHPSAPCLTLNVSFGDAVSLSRRTCGCPLERLGWRTHIHSIRSFEKLTSGGMTYPDSEIARILEALLPARFGGSPGSYQLVESEDADGRPRLHLLADPALGALDPAELGEAFLAAVGHGSGVEHLTAALWRQAGLVQVERRRPYRTTRGKVLHLHRLNSGDHAPTAAPV